MLKKFIQMHSVEEKMQGDIIRIGDWDSVLDTGSTVFMASNCFNVVGFGFFFFRKQNKLINCLNFIYLFLPLPI